MSDKVAGLWGLLLGWNRAVSPLWDDAGAVDWAYEDDPITDRLRCRALLDDQLCGAGGAAWARSCGTNCAGTCSGANSDSCAASVRVEYREHSAEGRWLKSGYPNSSLYGQLVYRTISLVGNQSQ